MTTGQFPQQAQQAQQVNQVVQQIPPKQIVYNEFGIATDKGNGPDGEPRYVLHLVSGAEMHTFVFTAALKDQLFEQWTGIALP